MIFLTFQTYYIINTRLALFSSYQFLFRYLHKSGTLLVIHWNCDICEMTAKPLIVSNIKKNKKILYRNFILFSTITVYWNYCNHRGFSPSHRPFCGFNTKLVLSILSGISVFSTGIISNLLIISAIINFPSSNAKREAKT